MVNWDTICRPKDKRGLGMREARDINKELLVKLHWRIYTDSSWAHMPESKSELNILQDLHSKHDHRVSFVWMGICWIRDLIRKRMGRMTSNDGATFF